MATQGGVIETKTIGLSIGTTGTFVNTELVGGQVQLKKKDNSPFLHEEGEWVSPVVDIGDNFQSYGKVFTTHVNSGSSSIAVLTRTSDNGIEFDAWTATAMDGSILSVKRRYISIKVVFYAAWGIQNIVISSLNNQTEALKFFKSEWIDTSNGLKLRRNHEIEMANSSTWSDAGTLHNKAMTRNDWAKINTLNVKNSGTFLKKTLILSNGEYKKVQNSTRYKDFAVSTTSIIPLMTSDTAPSGKAEASSVYVGEYNYLPYKAFNGGSKISDRWSITGNIGWIKYTFPKEKVVTAYSITTFNAATNYIKASPKDWTFEGSNDGTTWVVLDAQTNQTSWEHGVDKKFGFKNKTPYKSYRVNITMNNGDTYTAIYELKMFGNASDLEYYLEYKAVSSTLPTSNQFIDEGMDSLSPLLDRKVTTLVPQEMAQDTTWTEGGKVFKKSIDLKKYFDIHSINITN